MNEIKIESEINVQSGIKWTSISGIIVALLNILKIAIFARYLSPLEFGDMSILIVIIGFVSIYSDFGITQAIIHHQDTSKEILSSLYWLSIFVGILIFIVVNALNPIFVIFLKNGNFKNLIFLTSLIFLISAPSQQFQILLQKNLMFNKISIYDIISNLTGFILSILLLFLSFGVTAYVISFIVTIGMKSFLLIVSCWNRWKPKLHFKTQDLKNYIGFGLYQMGDRTVNYLGSNLDKILIVSLLGTVMLGYYNVAYTLVIYPILIINPIFTQVAFPIFAKQQKNRENLKKSYFYIIDLLSYINFPIFFAFASLSKYAILIIYGPQWTSSIIILQILAFVGINKTIGNTHGSLLLAKGYVKLGFYWNIFLIFTQFFGIYIGAKISGIIGISIALLILQTIYFFLSYQIILKKIIGPSFREYIKILWKNLSIDFILYILWIILDYIIPEIELIIKFCILLIIGIILFCILTILIKPSFFNEILTIFFPNKINKNRIYDNINLNGKDEKCQE